MDNFNRDLLLNEWQSNICDLNEEAPICRRGFSTIKNDEHQVYAHHYIAIEIYFNSFSSFSKKKIFLMVLIKLLWGLKVQKLNITYIISAFLGISSASSIEFLPLSSFLGGDFNV
jgi:hypothetical protein